MLLQWKNLVQSHILRAGYKSLRGVTTIAPAINLRPYQLECIQKCQNAVEAGRNRLAVSLATGGGKTVIFSHLVQQTKPSGSRSQTLILVHRRELVEQAANHCRRTCIGSTVELEMGFHRASGNADVTVCSVQSLTGRLENYQPERVRLIIIDEAHHAAAKTYRDILDYFGANTPETECIVIGFSATLFRKDGLQLAGVFDEIIFDKDYLSMMKDGYLCHAKFTCVKLAGVSLKGVKTSGPDGDFATGQLADEVNTPMANTGAVRAWIDRAANRKSTIVFAVSIQHVIDLADCFRQHGIDARAVTSRNDKKQRGEIIEAFKNGEFPVLVNCGILTEGFDSPNIDCVLLVRPTKSVGLLVQMIGRGLRLAENKADCHILDMTACLDVGVASIPTLFGLDAASLVDRETTFEEMPRIAQMEQQSEVENIGTTSSTAMDELPPVEVTYVDYDSLEDVVNDPNSHRRHISQLSRFCWVQIAPSKFILPLSRFGYIRILQNHEHVGSAKESWGASFVRKLPTGSDARLSRPRELLDPPVDSLERAIAACDSATVHLAPGIRGLLLRSATWRRAPASTAQVTYIKKLLGAKWDETRTITAGEAQDIITKCMHGVKGEIDRVNRERKREYKAQLKMFNTRVVEAEKAAKEVEKMAKRDRVHIPEVKVGPLL